MKTITMMNRWESHSEAEMIAFGQTFAKALDGHVIVGLSGPLGAGKTTFVRATLKALGVAGSIKSPSYTLVESYSIPQGLILHSDFYRLNSPLELEYLSIREESSTAKYCFIEWPEKGEGYGPPLDLCIRFSTNHETYTLDFEALTRAGDSLVQGLFQR